ncbi:MAG: hypothetical protein ACR2QS_06325, partial [Woeseiaceae bacterium]
SARVTLESDHASLGDPEAGGAGIEEINGVRFFLLIFATLFEKNIGVQKLRAIVFCILFFAGTSYAQQETPAKWIDLGLPTDSLIGVSEDTDEHGYYADYEGITEQELKSRVEKVFIDAGFQYAGDAFGGLAWGYQNNEEKYAVKIEYTGDTLHLSVFTENGNDPLIHGVIFSKYTESKKISGDAAREILQKDLEGSE